MFLKTVVFATMMTSVMCGNNLGIRMSQRMRSFINNECSEGKVEEAANTFSECLFNHIDGKFMSDLENADSQNEYVDLYKNVCEKIPEMRSCLHNFLNSTDQCFIIEYREEFAKAKKQFDEMFEYACGNNCQRFTAFVDDGGLECFEEKINLLSNCAREMIIKFNSNEENINTLKEVCNELGKFQTCVHNILVQCPKQSTVAYFDGFTEILRKYSECAKEN
ncbi:27 kDa hemolymph protein-like isoform 2-T2 [Aphomia sociella]